MTSPTPMTPMPDPGSSTDPGAGREPEAGAGIPQAGASPLDRNTYTQLKEPRHGLALDGSWHQISPRYVVSQVLQNIILIVIVAVAAGVLAFGVRQTWALIPGAVIVLITLITLIILPRQARAIGYMLRSDDIVFRRGILWQRMVAVPYGRMQLVDITQGPLDRAFGIAKLKLVTAAATTGVEIPGLTQQAAEALRDTLIEVAETRRTGL